MSRDESLHSYKLQVSCVVASAASRRTTQANKPKHGSRRSRTGTSSELQGATR